MAKLIYLAIASLDGYIADPEGTFDWAAPDEQVHAFVNDLMRPTGTYLYGRRMYEVMRYWETPSADSDPVEQDFAAVWQGAEKIIYSATLDGVDTARTRLERTFDPESVRQLKQRADRDLAIGGPHLAGHAIRAGLVDEYHLLLVPIVIGAGTRFLPDDVRVHLSLLDERRFDSGVVYLHYRAS
jgi:dihydrofolate reductase